MKRCNAFIIYFSTSQVLFTFLSKIFQGHWTEWKFIEGKLNILKSLLYLSRFYSHTNITMWKREKYYFHKQYFQGRFESFGQYYSNHSMFSTFAISRIFAIDLFVVARCVNQSKQNIIAIVTLSRCTKTKYKTCRKFLFFEKFKF